MHDTIIDKTKSAIEKIKYPRLLTVGAAVLLIGGGVAAYWALVQKAPLGNTPLGANIVPQDAIAAISVSTNKGEWQKLREFGTIDSRALFEQQLGQMSDRFLKANGYDYEKDIQPWVGREVMIAFLPSHTSVPTSNAPSNTPTSPSGKESVVLILPIDNRDRAKQLLEKPKPLKGGQWVDRTYREVKIKETQGLSEQNYSAALLDDRFLVVTTDPKATDIAIDTYKGSPSLATTPGYSEALAQIEASGPFARVYVNMPSAMATASMHSARTFPPPAKAPLVQQQGFATNITLLSEGIRFQGVSWLKPDSEKKRAVENKAKNMPDRLPADTLMMISGSNLNRLWQDYAEGAVANPLTPMNPDWLQKGVASNTGMDWEKDFMAWMAGEFSLSLIPAASNNSKQFPTAFVLMVQSNDRRLAEKSLKQLDGVMSTKYKFKVEEAKVNGSPLVNWISEYGGLTLSHGWLDGNVAFLTMGAQVAEAIAPKPQTSLALSEKFQKAAPSELKTNSGNFFIDVPRTLNANQLIFSSLPSVPKTILNTIRTIGVTAFISSDRTTRYDVLMALAKEVKPAAKPSPSKTVSPPKILSTPSPLVRPTPTPTTSPPKILSTPSPLVRPTPGATTSPSQPQTTPSPLVNPTPGATTSPSQPQTTPSPLVNPTPGATTSPSQPQTTPSPLVRPTPGATNSPPQLQATPSPLVRPTLAPTISPPKILSTPGAITSPPQPQTTPSPLVSPTPEATTSPPQPQTTLSPFIREVPQASPTPGATTSPIPSP